MQVHPGMLMKTLDGTRETGDGTWDTVKADGNLAADRRRIRQAILAPSFSLLSPEFQECRSIRGC